MKKTDPFLVIALVLVIFSATGLQGATFTNLHVFSNDDFSSGPNPQFTNSDGISPNGFVISGNTIYGTASSGGLYGYGTVFRVNTDGTHFTNLFNFNRGDYEPVSMKYPDNTGATPNPGLVLVSNTL